MSSRGLPAREVNRWESIESSVTVLNDDIKTQRLNEQANRKWDVFHVTLKAMRVTHLPSKSSVSIALRMTLWTAVVISSCDEYGAQMLSITLSCLVWERVECEEAINTRIVVSGHPLGHFYGCLHTRREEFPSS